MVRWGQGSVLSSSGARLLRRVRFQYQIWELRFSMQTLFQNGASRL
jgi:hypothetical protein